MHVMQTKCTGYWVLMSFIGCANTSQMPACLVFCGVAVLGNNYTHTSLCRPKKWIVPARAGLRELHFTPFACG